MLDKLVSVVKQRDWHEAERLLHEQWSQQCPHIFAPNAVAPWDVKIDDAKINDMLLHPIATAYCLDETSVGSDLQPLMVSCGLQGGALRSGNICGRVFRSGEATYTCKECASDPTCVMCYQCFQKSAHRNHKYRMGSSSGNGYCDCGDPDAWTEYPACELHQPTTTTTTASATATTATSTTSMQHSGRHEHDQRHQQQTSEANAAQQQQQQQLDVSRQLASTLIGQPQQQQLHQWQLSEEVSERIRALTRILLRYSTRLICWTSVDDLPDIVTHFALDSSLPPYQTILYNDETHTYDSVIRALHLSIHCDEQQAMLLATIVDREGRISVRAGGNDFCAKAKEEIQRRTQKDSNPRTEKMGPLQVRVLDTRLAAMQNYAIRLMSWLNAQTQLFPPLAWTIGDVLLNDRLCDTVSDMDTGSNSNSSSMGMDTENGAVDSDNDTLLVHLFKWDSALWKAARANFHQMLMATVLMNFEQKQHFSRQFIRFYKKMLFDFIDDDHQHSVSVISLSVQVFTIPTIARMLIADESAIEHILDTLIEHCGKYLKEPERKRFDFSAKSFPSVLRRALYMMYDLKYLLTVLPKRSQWTQPLRDNFLRGCYSFVKFLSYMQGMDEVKRLSVEHQLWESEWETAFNIQLRLQNVTTLLIAWACSDKYVHSHLMKYLINEIVRLVHGAEDFAHYVKIKVNDKSAMCLAFDVSKNKVSIHQPLWRLVAGLFAAPPEFLQDISSEIEAVDSNDTNEFLHLKRRKEILYEMPMRVLVLCAQSQAQMWRRNGFSLVNQIHNYLSPLCRSEMFDRDILMMQVGAALANADKFLIRLLNRFALHNWAEKGFEGPKTVTSSTRANTPEELSKSTVTLAEEMMHLIITIIGERFIPGVGMCTRKTMLRRDVLHILATGPKPFSQIDRLIPDCPLIEKISLDEIVKSIADFRQPTKSSAGMFTLKKSVFDEYSVYYYHYSKTDVSQAEQYQQKERASGDKTLKACPPPCLPQFEPFFRPIINLLRSSVLLNVVRVIIERRLHRNRYSSDALCHRALYLLGMGLREQAVDKQFDFIGDAEEAGIFELLEKLNGKPEMQANADLFAWILQEYKQVKALVSGKKKTENKKEENKQSKDAERQARRAAIAAKMRKQALEQMSRMQRNFISQNKDLLDAQKKDDGASSSSKVVDEDEEPIGVLSADSGYPVCLGAKRSEVSQVGLRRVTCILCQEQEDVKFSGRALVCVAFQHQSRLFTQRHSKVRAPNDLVMASSLPTGMNASTCGHTMHFECYEQYCDMLKSRDRSRSRQQIALNQSMLDTASDEYLCPLCKRLSNSALPLLPAVSTLNIKKFSECRNESIEFEDWVNSLSEILNEPLQIQSNKPSVRTHTRKRSHSERSLLDMKKQSNVPEPDSSFSTSVPSASSFSLIMDETADGTRSPLIGEGSDEADSEAHRSGGSGALYDDAFALALGLTNERSAVDEIFMSMFRPLPNMMNRIKGLMGHSKHVETNVPSALTTWEMIKCFMRAAHMRSGDKSEAQTPLTMMSKNVIETVIVWQMSAYALRAIAAVLRYEKKPLFGAFNTRQRECFYNLSRVCAVSAFNCRPTELRIILAFLLAPLLSKSSFSSTSTTSSGGGGGGASTSTGLTSTSPSGATTAQQKPTSSSSTSPIKIAVNAISAIPLPSLGSNTDVAAHPLATTTPSNSSASSSTQSSSTVASPPMAEGSSTSKGPSFAPFSCSASYALGLLAVNSKSNNILSIDMISLAFELAMCIGWTWVDGRMTLQHTNKNNDLQQLIPDGSVDEQYAIRLALIAHLYQIFVSFDESIEMSSTRSPSSSLSVSPSLSVSAPHSPQILHDQVDNDLDSIIKQLYSIVKPNDYLISIDNLKKSLSFGIVEFLRPLALLYHAITLVPPPEALKDPSVHELEPLCRYMGLPSHIADLLRGPCVQRLFAQWIRQQNVAPVPDIIRQPIIENRLVKLPEDFSELIIKASNFKCPSIQMDEHVSSVPTLCLVCGTLLCSQSYCCQRTINRETLGACSYHLQTCSGPSGGMFLRIRDSQVILLASRARGCFHAAPYVDEFGETDFGFRRGNPLHLNEELYAKLEHLWLHQGIYEEVVNQYEIDHQNVGFEWQHF